MQGRGGYTGERRGVVLQVGLPVGSKVMLQHRSFEGVLEGTARMARELKEKLKGKQPRAALGFECGGRTKPFLGLQRTAEENAGLRAVVGPDADWLTMVAWGELFPVGGRPGFHNYTYPLVVLAD